MRHRLPGHAVVFGTAILAPMIARDAGVDRKYITSAIDSGVVLWRGSRSGISRRFRGVSIIDGSTQLIRQPRDDSSAGRDSLNRATPDLAAAYAATPGLVDTAVYTFVEKKSGQA
jgi:hypothetical protein